MKRLFLTLIYLGITQLRSEAVVPSPDGGYPNFTTAEGTNALLNLTSGVGNTAVGWYSLFSAGAGSYNTGVGAGSLALNDADGNRAIGAGALLVNTTGSGNTANGALALLFNTTGAGNMAAGAGALQSNTTGSFNTANGVSALFHNTVGVGNTACGASTLLNNTTGSSNTASGGNALTNNTTGDFNTAVGVNALFSNVAGNHNTAEGYGALTNNIADDNTAYGYQTLQSNVIGVNNTAIGKTALRFNTGYSNTAIGDSALVANTSGFANTAIGLGALFENQSGSDNIGLGANTGIHIVTADHVICIGDNVVGADVSHTCFIGNIRGITTVNNDAVPVVIDSNQQLGTVSSSRRYKTDIRPIAKASESILALKPVSFRYNVHKHSTPQFGLIAEDVAAVNRNLVIYDSDGKPYTVRYEAVNAMLLNEFLKEHKKVEQLQATVSRQQEQIDALTAGLRKVSAQLAPATPSLADSR